MIDGGQKPGLSSNDHAELVAARRRIAELETELAILKRASEILKDVVPPKGKFEAIAVMAAEVLPIQVASRVLGVSESSFHAWRTRSPSARSIRHAWLTDVIRKAHNASHGTYGGRRVHAELTLAYGISVGHGAVEMLMHRAGIKGLPDNKRRKPIHQTPTAVDLVDRKLGSGQLIRSHPNMVAAPTGRRLIHELSWRQLVALLDDEGTPVLAGLSQFGMF